MLTNHDKWFLAFLAFSLCAGFLGFCGRDAGGEELGIEVEKRFRFDYERYRNPSIPSLKFRNEVYRNKTFWYGFSDPVPRCRTSRPVDDWNYRIIRQYERQRLRNESADRRFRNYFRHRR